MSIHEELRKVEEQKAKLEEQRTKLLESAKEDSLTIIHTAIKELKTLGFEYELVQRGRGRKTAARNDGATESGGLTRRTGIREQVLNVVQENGEGVTRAKVLELMDARGNKSAVQSVSNALAALKKAGTLKLEGGVYKAS